MAVARKAKLSKVASRWGDHDHKVFLLQGGGALGAYQAGVYAGLVESGEAPDWIAGVSIGAINATLIAGNPRSASSSGCESSGNTSLLRHRSFHRRCLIRCGRCAIGRAPFQRWRSAYLGSTPHGSRHRSWRRTAASEH